MSVVWFLSYRIPSTLLYAGLSGFTIIALKAVHPEKALLPMLVTLLGIIALVRLVQTKKAQSPILARLSGIDTFLRLRQSRKAEYAMVVTPLGIITSVTSLHFSNA